MQIDASFESIMGGFPFLEDMPDLIMPAQEPTTPDPRNELSKGWQAAYPDGMAMDDALSDSFSYAKFEDSAGSKFAMQPITGSDNFDFDLPPLKESPSPPTLYPQSNSDEKSGVVDLPFQPPQTTTIQIRSRPRMPMARSPLTFTAQHRIRCFKKGNNPIVPVKEEKQEVSECKQTPTDLEQTPRPPVITGAVPEEEESKPDKTADEVVDDADEIDANVSILFWF